MKKHLTISVGAAATTLLIAVPLAAREHCPDTRTETQAIVTVQTDIFLLWKRKTKWAGKG